MLRVQENTLTSQMGMLGGGLTRDRAEIQVVRTERNAAQTEVQHLHERVDSFEVTRRDFNAAITRLSDEIQ